MTAIRLATASSFRSFHALVNALITSGGQWEEQIERESLEDEFGRFRVWSGNLGALQKGHSSLDYRLRDSPLLSGNSLKFLEELKHNLDEAIAIVREDRLPYEQQPKQNSSERKEEEDEDDFFSEDEEEEEEANGSRKELTMRYEEIVDIIDNLYKLSVRIRTPTIRSRSLKAASYQPKDRDTGVDILSSYAQYDLQHVHELLRTLREPHIGDSQLKDEEYMGPRLARGITLRRRHFKYWKRHRDKLSAPTILEHENEDRQDHIKETVAVPLRNEESEIEAPKPMLMFPEPPSQKTGRTMLSGTEATHHHQSLDDVVDTKSVTSYAVTVTDIHGKGVNLPPPPKNADGERDFECPYCYIICPARYGRGRPWRTHLLQDLQPYTCTYPDCEASEQLFRSRREWNEHEANHRKVWRCIEHPGAIYRSRGGLELHLRQEHLDSIPAEQIDFIVKAGETSTIEVRKECPICFLPAKAEGMGDFANHVANHLERFAAFALPNSSEEDEDGASSVASRGRSGSITSQDARDMSLPSDNPDEQQQEEHLMGEMQQGKEEPNFYERGAREVPAGQSHLSVESLRAIPDISDSRLDTLLASQSDEQEDDEGEETKATTVDVEEHLERQETFKAYLLSLPGAQSVRFFKRYGSWKGNATFSNEAATAQAIELFDTSLYPDVKIQQGTESNSNKLKFSVHATQQAHLWQPTRQSTSNTLDADDRSISSTSMIYDDDETDQSKQPTLAVSDIPSLHEMYRSRKLLQRDQSFAPNDSYNRIISFCYYDLTRMKVDAIVNSANVALKPSRNRPTLDHHIHKAGGPKLSEEAKSRGRLKPGQAALTGGYNLPCAYVIHAARPQYGKNKGMGQFNILTECYRSALKTAHIAGFKTVAFPCLGAGGCGVPPRVAARIALQEMREYLDLHPQHPFERIIFVVKSVSDEKAYMDMFPAFFPPTHGDLEAARSSESSASRASLAAQALETRLQVQKVLQDLSAELSMFVPDFPKEIPGILYGIDNALASIRGFLIGSKVLGGGLNELNLFCYVMQSICGSMTELTESAKTMPFSGRRSHKDLWDDFNNHHMMVHGSGVEQSLKDCQNFVQYLDGILTRGDEELDEMTSVRLRLQSFKTKQRNQDAEGAHERLDEVLYTREFQREADPQTRDIVRLHQISSVAQLYALQKLDEKPTMVQPSAAFNHTVCLIREDITKLDVTVMVNSTDMTFAGMGTLDRKVFNKGGLLLREECNRLGVCKEGDVKLTGGYNLPSKHILHVVPPEQWRKNSKDVLRQIYREILYTAQSLRATSIAVPAIGTGMLNYPRRDCASLAMEEVNRFLETADPTNLLEKIVFVVYSSNDEFVYRSLLPVYFPPVDQTVNRALPGSHPIPKSPPPLPEPISAPRRTLFGSIGDAVRNLGRSRSGKRPVAHTWRAINTYEEHALIGFESHAQGCDICKTMEQLYQDKKDLCEHGYPLAQTLLWYMNLGPDELVYTRAVQIRQSIRLEVPKDMFPLCLRMLHLVEMSKREEGRETPFVSPNRAYSTVVQGRSEQDDDVRGPTIYNAGTARASVEVWSASQSTWSPVSPGECIIFIRPGKIDVYEAHAPSTAQEPLLTFVLHPGALISKHAHRPGLIVRGAIAAQFDNNEEILLLSQNVADSNALLGMLNRANPDFPSRGFTGPEAATDRPVEPALTTKLPDKAESDSEHDQDLHVASRSIDAQDPRESRLSPLQVKMQRLNEAASKFGLQSPQQRSITLTELGEDAILSGQPQPATESQIREGSSQTTLTALEHQILYYLNEDLKSRPGSYIGQDTNDIASALKRPSEEVSTATQRLAEEGYIHNTISEHTWVISQTPKELPVLAEAQPRAFTHALPSPITESGNKTDETDLLLQMNPLEQRILSFFTAVNTESPSIEGCRSEDIANTLNKNIDEVELALGQLAEQGKVHLGPDRKTWNTVLSQQHSLPSSSSEAQAGSSSEATNTRDATEFRDTPPSPVIPAIITHAQDLPVDSSFPAVPASLDINESSFYPYDFATRWTRIDASYVDPQVLANLDEEFHEDGYSLIVHRPLRRGELKDWVQKTLELRLKKSETARARGGVSGHNWLGKGKEKDERDRHQANLDRVLAGDMREDEIRHFRREDEAEGKW
ncbi:hypothetical protein SVAN01_05065 [Stagonosporopsis vannaccii]|nr:hypothetical protein SVAN01_05065 [Stagonosporopsis vannaccii]